jgi:hypothetical protein
MNAQQFGIQRPRALAAAAYAISAMLIFIPLMELGSQLGWSAHPSVLNWRTGAVGLLSGAILTPIFGIFIALITASLLGQRWVQRTLGALAALGGLGLLAILVVFTLDALQLRPSVTAAMKRPFDIASLKAVLAFAAGSGTLLCIGYSGLSAARKIPEVAPAARRAGTRENTPLVRTAPTQ